MFDNAHMAKAETAPSSETTTWAQWKRPPDMVASQEIHCFHWQTHYYSGWMNTGNKKKRADHHQRLGFTASTRDLESKQLGIQATWKELLGYLKISKQRYQNTTPTTNNNLLSTKFHGLCIWQNASQQESKFYSFTFFITEGPRNSRMAKYL
jgi:hypothetical protein